MSRKGWVAARRCLSKGLVRTGPGPWHLAAGLGAAPHMMTSPALTVTRRPITRSYMVEKIQRDYLPIQINLLEPFLRGSVYQLFPATAHVRRRGTKTSTTSPATLFRYHSLTLKMRTAWGKVYSQVLNGWLHNHKRGGQCRTQAFR